MEDRNNFSDALDAAIKMGCAHARDEVLKSGNPIFYLDAEMGIDVMEQPDGRRFEIRFIPGTPGDRNFEVVREVARAACGEGWRPAADWQSACLGRGIHSD